MLLQHIGCEIEAEPGKAPFELVSPPSLAQSEPHSSSVAPAQQTEAWHSAILGGSGDGMRKRPGEAVKGQILQDNGGAHVLKGRAQWEKGSQSAPWLATGYAGERWDLLLLLPKAGQWGSVGWGWGAYECCQLADGLEIWPAGPRGWVSGQGLETQQPILSSAERAELGVHAVCELLGLACPPLIPLFSLQSNLSTALAVRRLQGISQTHGAASKDWLHSSSVFLQCAAEVPAKVICNLF